MRKGVLRDLCFFKTLCLQVCFSWFLKPCNCIQTIRWTNSKSQTFVCTASVYTYRLERVGYRDFFNANRWQSMTCGHFCVIIDWSSIGRCQLTNKASIVIDWSIDFPIIWVSSIVHALILDRKNQPCCMKKQLLESRAWWFLCGAGQVIQLLINWLQVALMDGDEDGKEH